VRGEVHTGHTQKNGAVSLATHIWTAPFFCVCPVQDFGGETCGKETTWKTQVDGRIILKWIFKKWDEGAWTGLIWLRKGTGGGLLLMR
jgi:hypothetical protein